MRLAVALSIALLPYAALAARPERPDAHAEVEALAHEYIDGLFAARPHLASFMGDHRFDDRLMDLSEPALAGRRAALRALLARADALRPRAHGDDEVDLSILLAGARLELLYLDEIRDYAWDPRLYDSFPYYDPREVIADRLADLIHGDFQVEAKRRSSVIAELEALPVYLRQVEGWLARPYREVVPAGWRRPPRVYVEQAIKANRGRMEFMRGEVQAFVSREPKGRAAVEIALTALEAFQKFLEQELLPKADGDFRLGRALYDKKFALALQTRLTPDEAVRHAEAELRRSRKALAEVARELHAELWPGAPLPKPGAANDAKLIDKVKDALSQDHPKADDLVAAHARKLDSLRAFIQEHHLVDLPPKETLGVETMPSYKRGANGAEYLAPGVLERRPIFHATYYVDPVDPSWPPERVESYLRGQNDYEVELTASHEAYPGHHTQFAESRKAIDPLRVTLWNGPMVEGWAVYITSRMVAEGWGGARNLRYRFFELRGRMICAANLILDVKIQRGQMSDAEALRFLVEDCFQERATADKKLLRAKLDSTQLCQYELGLDEIEALREEVAREAKARGRAFDEHDFHERLISHGPIAVTYLRRYALGR